MSSGPQAADLTAGTPPPLPLPSKVKPCNECSRLKLKCSRAPWPCQSCRQRSLSHLCPDGQLSTRPYKKRRTTHTAQSAQSTSSLLSGSSSHIAHSSSPSTSPLEEAANVQPGDARQTALSSTPNHRQNKGTGHTPSLPDAHSDPSPSTIEGAESSGILLLASHALSRSPSITERPPVRASPSPGDLRLRTTPRDGHRHTASSVVPSSEAQPGDDGQRTRIGRGDHLTPNSKSERASEDAGLLIENEQGTYSFYGPQSHSYNLAQLFAGRPSPPLALPPLRRIQKEAPSTMIRDERPSELGFQSPSSSTREENTITQSLSQGRRGWESPYSIARAIQERILTDPAQFLAMPGAPSPFAFAVVSRRLKASLPPAATARRAFLIYRRNVAWLYNPLPLLSSVWNEAYGSDHSSDCCTPLRLALVFGILCLGSLFDVGHSPRHQSELEERSDSFFQRAWAACLSSNITDSPLLEQVQVFVILSQYLCNRSNGYKADSSFPLIGMAMRTAVTLGLHRGAAVKGGRLSEEQLQERHQAFWELYSQDAFRSLAYGRPCSIQDAHVDTPFPTRGLGKSNLARIFHIIKYETARLLNQILDVGQRTQSPDYSEILGLDRSLRKLWGQLPARFRPSGARGCLELAEEGDDTGAGEVLADFEEQLVESELQILLQGNTAIANISQTLLHLHRPWFVRALRSKKSRDRSKDFDILDSPYARSVVAVSESSRSLIDVAQSMLEAAPTLSKSWNYVWHHCFNAAVCQCLHTLQEPNSVSALGAWDDVRRAISILRRARPDRSDIVWAGKLDLLEALQKKTDERVTDNVAAERRAGDISRRQSIAERHMSLVGGGGAINGNHRKRRAQREDVVDVQQDTRPLDPSAARVSRPTADERQSGETLVSSSAGYSSLSSGEAAMHHNVPSPISMTTATPPAEEWLNTLSDDLAGFLTSRQQQPQQDNPPTASTGLDGVLDWQQSSTWAGTDLDAANAGFPSMRFTQAPATVDSSQSWNTLLTDLLQVGCEPDANFWAAIARDTR